MGRNDPFCEMYSPREFHPGWVGVRKIAAQNVFPTDSRGNNQINFLIGLALTPILKNPAQVFNIITNGI